MIRDCSINLKYLIRVDLVLPALLVSEDHLAQKVLKEIEEPPDLLDPLVQQDPKGP